MAEEHQRKRVFFVVDYERDGYSVFKVNLKDLFSDHPTSPPPVKMEMLPLPGPPVASFHEPEYFRGDIAFALSGTTIVGLGIKRTFTYDIKAQAAGSAPGTAATKYGTFVLRVGAHDVYALSIFPQWGGRRDRPHLEALSPGKGLTLAWRALSEPPPERLFGFCPRRRCLCACDMDARPPVVRDVWEDTWPGECVKIGYGVEPDGSLVYLGGGRLCTTRLIDDNVAFSALCVQAVQLQLRQRHRVEMVMLMRRIRCYTMSKLARRAYALQPSTS